MKKKKKKHHKIPPFFKWKKNSEQICMSDKSFSLELFSLFNKFKAHSFLSPDKVNWKTRLLFA